jgi:hypothetical protein
MSKVIPLNPTVKEKNIAEYISPYDPKVNEGFIDFLDQVFAAYQKSHRYEYLTFSDKINMTFKYHCMREFILNLKR